jgi:type II secretory pathway pseudopilin PulG
VGRGFLHAGDGGDRIPVTLLEAMVALVILGLSAVGYLDVFQSSARSVRDADEWARTVAVAQSTMEAAALGDALQAQDAALVPDERFTRRVEVRPWSGRVSEVVVTVTSPRGTTFTLRRLTRAK